MAGSNEAACDSTTIELQPWSRIERSLMIGSRAGSNEIIVLRSEDSTFREKRLIVYRGSECDAEGKFHDSLAR